MDRKRSTAGVLYCRKLSKIMSDTTDFGDYHSVAESFDPRSSPPQTNEHSELGSTAQSNEDSLDSIITSQKLISPEPGSLSKLNATNGSFQNEREIEREIEREKLNGETSEREKLNGEIHENKLGDNKLTDTFDKKITSKPSQESSPPLKRDDDFLDDDFFVIGGLSKKKKKVRKHKKPKRESPDIPLASKTPSLSLGKADGTPTQPQNSSLGSEPVEHAEKPPPLAKKTGSITPPPILDTAWLSKLPSPKLMDRKLKKLSKDLELANEDSDDDVEVIEQPTATAKPADPYTYTFDDAWEKKRPYIFKVISKVPGSNGVPLGASLDFSAKGSKKFGRIFESVLGHFITNLRLEPIFQADLYTTAQTSFIWVEGKTEIRPFYKPSTLRVPPPVDEGFNFSENTTLPPTFVTMLLIPKSHSKDYLQLYPEFNKSNPTFDQVSSLAKEIEQLEKQERLEVLEDDDDSLLDDQDVTASVSQKTLISDEVDSAEDVDGYFVIGLKGDDNKRVEVQVSHETPIRKILSYYLGVKKINESSIDLSKVKLIFDDEPLDINGLVGDTELEEEFEVQIVL